MIPMHFLIPILVFSFFWLITQNIGGGILFLLMYIIIIKLFNQNLINDKLKNRQNINNLNLIRHNLPLTQQNELSKIDNIGFGRSYVNFKNLERDSMKESMVKLSQISLQKWFLVIIPLILAIFFLVIFNFYYYWVNILIFYYVFIGIIYLVLQLINKIYNSKSFAKTKQNIQNKTDNNSSKQTGIRNKIKSNLLSNWHFWAILVFNFLGNSVIGFVPLITLIFREILFSGSSTTVLIIYLNLLILGIFIALIFFGIKNRINSILLSTILTVSLFWSLTNIYIVNTYYNFANFSTCKDFRILSDRGYLSHFPSDKDYISRTMSEVKKLSDRIEIRISQYDIKDFKTEKIGEISKLDKIKTCLIPIFENKKVILIEEKTKPKLPFPLIDPNLPLPTDFPANLPPPPPN